MSERPVLRTALCDLLGIEYPILLAGMGIWGMATPPALVAAVSNAGGLGVLGCSGLPPEEIRRRIAEVRTLTDKPFGVDLLLPASLADAPTTRSGVRRDLEDNHPAHVAFMRKLLADFGVPETPVQDEFVISPQMIEAQIQVTLDEAVPVFVAGLGDPAIEVPRGHAQGMKVMGIAGSARNAARHARSGADAVICQGTEGGGHTGRVAGLPLLAQTLATVGDQPVLAAGGIVDGRGIAAALTMGAAGVWIGTAFLVADECGIADAMKDAIVASHGHDMQISRSWTGKTLRSQKNAVVSAWEDSGLDPLPTPHQRVLMEDFLESVKAAGRWELFMNAAGQGAGLIRERRPAAAILDELVAQTVATLQATSTRIRTG